MGVEIVEDDVNGRVGVSGDDIIHEVEEFDAPPTVLSGLKWSSQHPDEGGCDEDSKAAFGSVWTGAIVVANDGSGRQ